MPCLDKEASDSTMPMRRLRLLLQTLMFLRLYITKSGIANNPNLGSKNPNAKAIPDRYWFSFAAKIEAEQKQEGDEDFGLSFTPLPIVA